MPMLSESQKQEALEKLKPHYKGCPICGVYSTGSSMGDVVALPLVEKAVPKGLTPGNQFMPMIPISCNRCGHTVFFMAATYITLDV